MVKFPTCAESYSLSHKIRPFVSGSYLFSHLLVGLLVSRRSNLDCFVLVDVMCYVEIEEILFSSSSKRSKVESTPTQTHNDVAT